MSYYRASRGWASLTASWRPITSLPFIASITAAISASSTSTKRKPFLRPVSRSVGQKKSATGATSSKSARSSVGSIRNGTLPTKSRLVPGVLIEKREKIKRLHDHDSLGYLGDTRDQKRIRLSYCIYNFLNCKSLQTFPWFHDLYDYSSVYIFYERMEHIWFIMDGNRRWAKNLLV